MKKNDLYYIVNGYGQNNNIKDIEEDEELEEKENKLFKKIFLSFSIWYLFFVISIGIVIGIIFFFINLLLLLFGGGAQTQEEFSTSMSGSVNYSQYFSSDNENIPFGIPIERAKLNDGVDYTKYQSKIFPNFLKINYPGVEKYYAGHQGQDFCRTYADSKNQYYPLVFSTLKAIVKETEVRDSDYNYTKNIYNDGTIIKFEQKIAKSKEKSKKPYGLHVILGSLDGKFYVMYAHLSAITSDVLSKTMVEKGLNIGRLGNTGNSTGPHLHYEIRYCGTNNTNFAKTWNDCSVVNPLSFYNSDSTFIGFSSLPKVNLFTAGDTQIKDLTVNLSSSGSKDEMKKECSFIGNLGSNTGLDCNGFYPIYLNKELENYPKILDNEEKKQIGKNYILNKYKLTKIGFDDLVKINTEEKTSAVSDNELYQIIGARYTHGVFNNKSMAYLISDKISQEKMLNDAIKTFNSLKSKYSDIKTVYEKYYDPNGFYSSNKNPYVYNNMDKDHIFMDIYSIDQITYIGKYSKEGVWVKYNKLK